MKKTAIVGLMLAYLFSAIGVTVTNSYCCGALESTSLSIGESYSAHHALSPGAGNCCKTIKQSFKVKDQHFASATFPHFVKSTPALFAFTTEHIARLAEISGRPVFNSHAPPGRQNTPIYTWNCTYRI